VLKSSANPELLFIPSAELRVSLSPGEKAGVRGNCASELVTGSGTSSGSKGNFKYVWLEFDVSLELGAWRLELSRHVFA
jgi:hypothetical protein